MRYDNVSSTKLNAHIRIFVQLHFTQVCGSLRLPPIN